MSRDSKQEADLQDTARLVKLRTSRAEYETGRRAGSMNDREVSPHEKGILDVGWCHCEGEGAAPRTIEQVAGVGVVNVSARLNVFRPDAQRYPVFEIVVEQDSRTIRVYTVEYPYFHIFLGVGVLIVGHDHQTPLAVHVNEVVDLLIVQNKRRCKRGRDPVVRSGVPAGHE